MAALRHGDARLKRTLRAREYTVVMNESRCCIPVIRPRRLWVFHILWAALVVGGLSAVALHDATPGTQGSPPATWPAQSAIPRHPGRATLLVFAHPQCPCVRASLEELARLMASAASPPETWVVFYSPTGDVASWQDSGRWSRAASIPGVQVIADADGHETDMFGARTSGQAIVYDELGNLSFQGGITPSRGHCGDNQGRRSLQDIFSHRLPATVATPVFGCPLNDSLQKISGDE